MKQLTNKFTKFATLFFLVLLCLTPLVWFYGKGDVLINGIDTNFPLDPLIWFQRRFYVWNSVVNAGIDFSSSTAGLFFHFIQVVPYVMGFSLQTVEIFSFVFWFASIVLFSFLFARTLFPKNIFAQLVFVVLYTFNIYLFNSWENVKVANLSLISAIPLGLWILLSLKQKKISLTKASLYSVVTGIIVSGSGINPAYFFVFFIILFIFQLSEIVCSSNINSALLRIKELAFVCLIIILVNLFWIIPTASFIFSDLTSSNSIDSLGFTNWVDSLSKDTSLLNIMRIRGAWDWYTVDGSSGLPLYIPYALNYFYRIPFILFSFGIPSLVIVSLVIRNQKKKAYYLSFAVMFIVGVFLGAGTHPPSGTLFRFLLENVPFFSLFRSPWYIFTPLVTLSTAGLVGLLVFSLDEKFKELKFTWGRTLIGVSSLVLIMGNFLYTYPLVSGKIFRPGRADGFYVKFPDYVFDSKNILNSNYDKGRVIGYPDDEIEQFTWGYRGIESVLSLVSNKEMLFAPLNASDSGVARLIKQFYLDLKKEQLSSAKSIAEKLDIDLLFEKKDQTSLSPKFSSKITNLPNETFGEWSFYDMKNFADSTNFDKIFSTSDFLFGDSYSEIANVIGSLRPEDLLINPDDTVVKDIHELQETGGQIVIGSNKAIVEFDEFMRSSNKLSNRLKSRDLSRVDFSIDIPEEGNYQPALEKFGLEDFGLGQSSELEVIVDGNKVKWERSSDNDSYIYFKSVFFSKGEHEITFNVSSINLVNDISDRGQFVTGKQGEFEYMEEQGNVYLRLINKVETDISAKFEASNFNPFGKYLIQLDFKRIYGRHPLVLFGQNRGNVTIKNAAEALPSHPEWATYSFYYSPVQTDSNFSVLLIAPQTGEPLGTKILYDNLIVQQVFSNNLVFIKDNQDKPKISPEITYDKVSPVLYNGIATGVRSSHVIVFSENYSSEWRIRLMTRDGNKIPIDPPHFSANLYANAWFIENVPESYSFEIYYRPQRLFKIGLSISFLTIVIVAFFIVRKKITK